MRLIDLFEYNEQRLINDFGKKLISHASDDTGAPRKTPKHLIQMIAEKDPTPNKELTFWLCLNYANNGIQRWEDIDSRAIPALLKFKALLRKPNLNPPLLVRDINQIKGLSALEDIVEKYEEKDTTSTSELANKEEQNFYKTNQAELIYNDAQIKVVSPKTAAASRFFGIHTRWCTAAKKNNRFTSYNEEGPLYIVLIKPTNERYQFHFQSKQFMNEKDKKINPNKLADKYTI